MKNVLLYENFLLLEYFDEHFPPLYLDKRVLGKGMDGVAYKLISKGKVLKITRSESEYLNMTKLIGQNNENLVHVYKTGKYQNGAYFIVMELLDKLDERTENIISNIWFSIRHQKIDGKYLKNFFYKIDDFTNISLLKYFDDKYVDYDINILRQLDEINKQAKKNKIDIIDFHIGNLGMRGDKIVMFDIK